VTPWQVVFTKQAQKDARRLASAGLRLKAEQLLTLLGNNPFQRAPPFEKLLGDLRGAYSRRINIQHRLVHQVLEEEHIVKVLRMWTHYE
jgi:toxin YoeB